VPTLVLRRCDLIVDSKPATACTRYVMKTLPEFRSELWLLALSDCV
jgi:hypothetical protein